MQPSVNSAPLFLPIGTIQWKPQGTHCSDPSRNQEGLPKSRCRMVYPPRQHASATFASPLPIGISACRRKYPREKTQHALPFSTGAFAGVERRWDSPNGESPGTARGICSDERERALRTVRSRVRTRPVDPPLALYLLSHLRTLDQITNAHRKGCSRTPTACRLPSVPP